MAKKPSGAAVTGPRHSKAQGLHKYKDGVWGVDCRIFGERVRRKVGSEKQAREYLNDLKAAERQGTSVVTPRSQKRKTLGDWVDVYLQIPRGKTDAFFAKHWRTQLGTRYPEQVTAHDLRAWAFQQIEKGGAVASVHRMLASLSTIYSEAIRSGEVTSAQSPFRDKKALGLPKINNVRLKCLSERQQIRLCEVMGERWIPYLEFSILTGMRFGEQANLRWDDIRWRDRLCVLWDTKSQETQTVPLSAPALEILHEMNARPEVAESEFCFPSIKGCRLNKNTFRTRVWRDAFDAAGLQDYVWHDLRHTCAGRLIRAGHSLPTIQSVLRQKDPRTAQRYAYMGESPGRSALDQLGESFTRVRKSSEEKFTDAAKVKASKGGNG